LVPYKNGSRFLEKHPNQSGFLWHQVWTQMSLEKNQQLYVHRSEGATSKPHLPHALLLLHLHLHHLHHAPRRVRGLWLRAFSLQEGKR